MMLSSALTTRSSFDQKAVLKTPSVLGATRSCSGVLLSAGLMRRAASMAESDLDLPTLWLRKRNWHGRVRLGAAASGARGCSP